MAIAKNQLSPTLISLWPLITTLTNIFPHIRLQSSGKYISTTFNLIMISSVGFGSNLFNSPSLQVAFASPISSLNKLTCWPIMQKVRCLLPNCLRYSIFRIFSLPTTGSFQLSLTVLYAIDLLKIFRLRWWSTPIQTTLHYDRFTHFN